MATAGMGIESMFAQILAAVERSVSGIGHGLD